MNAYIFLNKGADQLGSNCFRYMDSTIPLLLESQIFSSSHLLSLHCPVCFGPGHKSQGPVFSLHGSYVAKTNVLIS